MFQSLPTGSSLPRGMLTSERMCKSQDGIGYSFFRQSTLSPIVVPIDMFNSFPIAFSPSRIRSAASLRAPSRARAAKRRVGAARGSPP